MNASSALRILVDSYLMPGNTDESRAERDERYDREQREKEQRAVADQIRARRRSNSRDVTMNERGGNTGTGRTISNLLGLGNLLPFGSSHAIADTLAADCQTSATVATQPDHHVVAFDKAGLKISFSCSKGLAGSASSIIATFRNSLDAPITDFVFEVAVPKSMRLTMHPATSQVLPPGSDSVSQTMSVVNESDKGLGMKLRIKYSHKGQIVQEVGQVGNFPTGY